MDKKTAMYWQKVIEKAEQMDKDAMGIYLEECDRRRMNQLPRVEVDIAEALNPPKPAPQREPWQLPPIIDEWP